MYCKCCNKKRSIEKNDTKQRFLVFVYNHLIIRDPGMFLGGVPRFGVPNTYIGKAAT